jgi:hypothetical protein
MIAMRVLIPSQVKRTRYQGNTSPSGPIQSYEGNNRGKRGTGNKMWKNIVVNKSIRQ